VPVRKVVFWAYVISGACAGLASVLYTGRLETGSPVMGQRVLLDVVSAAVIGGVSLFGGRGRLAQAAVGALLISMITNGLGLLGLSAGITFMVTGGVLILAATIDAVSRRRPGVAALVR